MGPIPKSGWEVVSVEVSPGDGQSGLDPVDLQDEAASDDEETSSSSESTSSDSSCSTRSLPNTSDTSNTEEAVADMAGGMVGDPFSDSEWYQDVSATEDETGQRVMVSEPVPKHDGSQGPV